MTGSKGQEPGNAGLVFVAWNTHSPSCGEPPRVRTTENPGLYYGYFENRFGEQFVFTFDRTTKTGTVSGGDLDWGNPRPFTLVELEAIVHDMRGQVAEAVRHDGLDQARVPELDAALALGRLTGVTGKDEIIWLRACLKACSG